ncbi:MAG: type III-B CRISPR module-associated protein Cmr3 [Moorellaceae bacterium]
MWQVFIEPNDVLLFRDGKPFAAGEDHRARSFFPPTPFTMQGVVRAKVLFASGVILADYAHGASGAQDLIRKIGIPGKSYGQLRLRGPFVAKRNDEGHITRYFPLPADVAKVGDRPVLVKPLLARVFTDNRPLEDLHLLWAPTHEPLEEARGWVAEQEFRKYLQGQQFSITEENELLLREPHLGIALDHERRSTQEEKIYQMEFLRLREGVGFLLEVEGIEPFEPRKGFLQIGGEARPAYYEVLSHPLDLLPLPNPLPRRFKVVLLTPAWFTGGWQPQGGNWGQFFNGNVRLVSAAVPRAQSIGGAYVDDVRRRGDFQKTMRRFVPAGSVFFFESEGSVTMKGRPFTETPDDEGDFGQIGFGCTVITGWNEA